MALARGLAGAVVVVTGASGGIGAATAVRLAQHGTTVVVGARRERALEQVADACRVAGGRSLAVRTDVADQASVEALADAAIATYGHLDGWVNNAAVAAYGGFAEVPIDEFRRIIDTDLLGVVYGCRAALPRLAASGGGVIVNLASVLANLAMPYLSAYNISKQGVRALSDTLRHELSAAGEHRIHICTLLPASIDTPFFRHAANHTGRPPQPPPPVNHPDRVALTVRRMLEHPRREAYVGAAARVLDHAWRFAPALIGPMLARYAKWAQFADGAAAPSRGNVFAPADEDAAIKGRIG